MMRRRRVKENEEENLNHTQSRDAGNANLN
jgi:hypothetical protein